MPRTDYHLVQLTEEQRHIVLYALAHLAVDRPHWDEHLASVAATMDERGPHCQPQLFFNFKLQEIDPLCQLRGHHYTSPTVSADFRSATPITADTLEVSAP